MDEIDAIEALENLGLSNYEAKVFTALQKLGTGTARDVHRITDVPRSQVYGAAESLEERGLIEVQQSKPIQYRPVSLEAAKSHLRGQFERTQERAFEYLETARKQNQTPNEEQEDIWTVRGRDSVSARVEQLLETAERRIVFGLGENGPEPTERTAELLCEKAESGIEVIVVTNAGTHHRSQFSDEISVVELPEEHQHDDDPLGRVAVVDDDTVLMSVRGDLSRPEFDDETAIWSSETGFAAVLIRQVYAGLGDVLTL